MLLVNGQTAESEKKVKSESDKMKDIKTPDSKVSKKKERTPRRETKVVGCFFLHLKDNLKVEKNDLFFNNKLLVSNLLLEDKSLFSTFKLSLTL